MIEAQKIAEARAEALAAASSRRVVDVLEEKLALEPDDFAERLAATFRYGVLRMEELRRLEPRSTSCRSANARARAACCCAPRPASCFWRPTTRSPPSRRRGPRAHPRAVRLAPRAPRRPRRLSREHEETLRALDAVSAEAGAAGDEDRDAEDLSLKAIADEKSEVVRLVRSTLRDALKIGASDIHLETVAAGLVIKFRIDGILIPIKQIEDRAQAEQAIARVKVLAELDVTERRVPQDGRFKALDRGRAIDFRVSIMPSIHGEDAVLRVLDKQSLYESTRQTLARQPRVRGARHQGAAAPVARAARDAARHGADRQRQDHRRSTPRSARSTRARTRSSPSRTRSSTSFRACCRSR